MVRLNSRQHNLQISSFFLAIKTPYAQCDLFHGQENSENRPPFVNYGGRYSDKQTGEKRTFNSLAIHVRN